MKRICFFTSLFLLTCFVFADDWNKTESKLNKLLKSKEVEDLEELESLVSEIAIYNNPNACKSFRQIVENTQKRIEEVQIQRWRLIKSLTPHQLDPNQTLLDELSKKLNILQRINSKVRDKLSDIDDNSAINWLLKEGLKSENWIFREMIYFALSDIKSKDFDSQILEKVELEEDSRVKITAIECLKKRKIRADDFFIRCLKENLWQVKSAAAEAIGQFRIKEAIVPLIDSMKNETSILVLEAIAKALFLITGRNFSTDYSKWADWWKEVKDNFSPPSDESIKKLLEGLEKEKESDTKHTNTFFGIEIKSTRICFVLDVSGSMADPHEYKPEGGGVSTGQGDSKDDELEKPIKGTKLDIAKFELKKVIKKIKKTTKFNIIFYSDIPKTWSDELVQATNENKEKAYKFIDRQIPLGGTNIYDSTEIAMNIGQLDAKKLESSFTDAVDTIYLLSDGLPNRGTFTSPRTIIEKICELNTIRKIKIHTIAIGKDADMSFMKNLAKETGGTFVKR